MNAPPAPVNEGDILAGKYRVEKVLGVGGMGVVVAASHVQLGQRVALKFLLPHAAGNGEAVARFLREGQAAVRLRGEHVAQVTDVGTLESGSPYMVMEYLQGLDLAALLLQRGPLPVDVAADYLLQVCEALAEAHAAGIVHRDLKPANFFLASRPDGTPIVKVLDFGISKLADGSGGALTQTSNVMGSPYYMSPEQMRSTKNVDARTDVWALGVSLFELTCGKVPFPGDTMPELCTSVLMNPTPLLRSARADLPDALQTVLAAALEKDADKRYPDVAHFARALLPFAPASARLHVERIERLLGNRERITSTPPSAIGPVNPDAATVHASSHATWGNSQALAKPSKVPLVIGVVAVAAVAGAVGFFASRSTVPPKPPPVAAAAAASQASPPPVVSAEPKVEPTVAPVVTPSASAPATVVSAAPTPAVRATGKIVPVAPATPTKAAPAPTDSYVDTRK